MSSRASSDGNNPHSRRLFESCLEVIVTSLADAEAAALGGADRLELVRDLKRGGLTPDAELVRSVVEAVSIPVRVMLRETATMQMSGRGELRALIASARNFAHHSIDGFVLGWVSEKGRVDEDSLGAVLAAASGVRATFHRAFEHLEDHFAGIALLKKYSQIDRILTNGGAGSWAERKQRLLAWRDAAAPEITIMAGGDLSAEMVVDLMTAGVVPEIHVGRAVRQPEAYDGVVDSQRVAALKSNWR